MNRAPVPTPLTTDVSKATEPVRYDRFAAPVADTVSPTKNRLELPENHSVLILFTADSVVTYEIDTDCP
jgi:hypothetical protein